MKLRSPKRDSLDFDLAALRVFLAVFESGGMSAAARRLGMTQSAVSQSVARLEAGFGMALFERASRPLQPTAAGLDLAAGARRLLTEGERLQAAVREAAGAALPAVRIGLIDSFAATVGPSLVRKLRNHAERLTVWSGISPNLGDDLVNRRLDFIVSSDPMKGRKGLARRRLLVEPFLLVLPRRMASAIDEVRLEDLARNHAFIRYSGRSLIGAQIERHLEDLQVQVPQSLEFDGTDPVFAMVSGGIGWAITTPLCLVHGRALAGELSAVPLPGPAMSRSLYLVFRRGETGKLPRRIIVDAEAILGEMVAKDVLALAPWAAARMAIGP